MSIKIMRNLFLLISVYCQLSFANPEFIPSNFFKSGTVYSYKAGTRGFGGGVVRIEQINSVLHFKLKLRFLAAGTFSRTNLKEVLSISHPMIPPTEQFFPVTLNSFSDNKILKEKIQALAKFIESKYKSKYTRLHIDVEFGLDSEYLTSEELSEHDYKAYLSNLRNAVNKLHQQKNTDAIPISIVALPEANRASPSEWDLYSDPRLFSHELFHIIGSMFEGYEHANYPPNGMMQDLYMINAVDKFGNGCPAGILNFPDVLELLSNSFGSTKRFVPAPDNIDKLDAMINNYAAGHLDLTDNPRLNYLTWTPQQMADSAKQTVLNWIKSASDCNQSNMNSELRNN